MTGPQAEYFQSSRDDVARLVPPPALRVLDVGCGFGGLGRTLQKRGTHELYGVERNPEAPPHLDGVYTQYWIGDVEQLAQTLPAVPYDCIVFADILEHLVDPWRTLARYARLLKPGGTVVASIPNVRNFVLLASLIVKGRWTYRDHGLLDRTHLRFFTRRDIEQMFADARLRIETWGENRDCYPLAVRIAAAIPLALIPDLGVCQFLVQARREA
jgi:2-polyprenyl-3-methyl-5-hydroxy-6-metoxy-1,4-benzoquinol methylase